MKTTSFKKQLSSKIGLILLFTLLFFFDQKTFASGPITPVGTFFSVGIDTKIQFWGTAIKAVLDAAVAVFALVWGFYHIYPIYARKRTVTKEFHKVCYWTVHLCISRGYCSCVYLIF